ncbi:hypothetical protein LC612_31850 [Nostoc sp. CHAB 5834]|nr:hypothetical protein [Nostoc sp. CHAB 5834]
MSVVTDFLQYWAPLWRGVALRKGEYVVEGWTVRVNTDQAMLQALLMEDYAELDRLLGAKWKVLQQEVEAHVAKWLPTVPSWMPRKLLERWAKQQAATPASAHPAASIAEAAVASLAVLKMPSKVLKAPMGHIVVTWQGQGVCVAVDVEKLAAKLWSQSFSPAVSDALHKGLSCPETAPALLSLPVEFLDSISHQALGVIDSKLKTWKASVAKAKDLSTLGDQAAIDEFLGDVFKSALGLYFEPSSLDLRLNRILEDRFALQVRRRQLQSLKTELPSRLQDFYPLARRMGRKITFFHGPTNSGKTFRALAQLKAAESGVYLGPLRLLAFEVFEKLKSEGMPVNLVTGEWVQMQEDARHSSATVEMVDFQTPIDVAVLDEVQMLADPQRGGAWLQAMLGVPARHVILVGAPAALPRVRKLAAYLGEPLEEVALERLTPLTTAKSVFPVKSAGPGTAFIVFSRREALALAQELRIEHKKSVSVIYGALSPEVRTEQARMFADGKNDVLVATDAIAMGLNLPIQTVVFTRSSKWNGEAEEPLAPSLVAQIAGRAGRFGLKEEGVVAALDGRILNYVTASLGAGPEPLPNKLPVGISPPLAQTISQHTNLEKLEAVLTFFQKHIVLEDWAVSTVTADEVRMAHYLDSHPLSFSDRLSLLHAPAFHQEMMSPMFEVLVQCLVAQKKDNMQWIEYPTVAAPLENLEGTVRDLTLYCWMHYRHPNLFPKLEAARTRLREANEFINAALTRPIKASASSKNKS